MALPVNRAVRTIERALPGARLVPKWGARAQPAPCSIGVAHLPRRRLSGRRCRFRLRLVAVGLSTTRGVRYLPQGRQLAFGFHRPLYQLPQDREC